MQSWRRSQLVFNLADSQLFLIKNWSYSLKGSQFNSEKIASSYWDKQYIKKYLNDHRPARRENLLRSSRATSSKIQYPQTLKTGWSTYRLFWWTGE